MDKKIKIILIIILLLIILAIGLTFVINVKKPSSGTIPNTNTNAQNIAKNENYNDNIESARNEKVGNLPEASRIKTYIGQYFTKIQSQEYNDAYNMLFEKFKNNYFKTEQEYEKYAKNKYPQNIVIKYGSMDREGELYIITVNIIDGLNTSNSFQQQIVVQETDLYNYYISFQVE